MALASPIYRASTGDTNRLYYRPEGGDYTQITGPSMLQNLAKAGQVEVGKAYQAYDPSASVAPQNTPSASSVVSTPVNTPSPVSTPTVGPLEQSPGVFKASALTDFYNNQISLMRPQYEAAQKQVQEINNQINNLKAPDYQSLYNTQYSQNVGQIDADLKATSEKLTGLDTTIRSLEDAVRQEVGGAASEAVIQAEVARRAKPLLLQRQTIVDQLGNLQSVKQNATQNIMQGLQFQQQSFQDSNALLDKRLSLAQSVQNSFNSLLEKGATATEKERDDFRSLFSTLLTNSPDVLNTLTQDEVAQLQTGFLPQSVMSKIGETIAQQKLAQQKPTIEGSAETGYYERQKDGSYKQVIPPVAQGGKAGDYEVVQDQKTGAFYRINKLSGVAEPVLSGSQFDGLTGAGMGAPAGAGSISYRTNNPGNIKFGEFAKSQGAVDSGIKATDGGTFAKFPNLEAGKKAQLALLTSPNYANLTLDAAMRRWSNNGYGADVADGAIPANKKMKDLSSAELSTLQAAMQKREGFNPPAQQFSTTPKEVVNPTEKPLSGEASKLLAITETIAPEIDELKKAFNTNYRGSLLGITSGTDRKLVKLLESVADKVGRLRSGGAINKDEADRFKMQIASKMDIPFGDKEDAIASLDALLAEANTVRNGLVRGSKQSSSSRDISQFDSSSNDLSQFDN